MPTSPIHETYQVPLICNSTRSFCSDSARLTPPIGCWPIQSQRLSVTHSANSKPSHDVVPFPFFPLYVLQVDHLTTEEPHCRQPDVSTHRTLTLGTLFGHFSFNITLDIYHLDRLSIRRCLQSAIPGTRPTLTERRWVCEIYKCIKLALYAPSTPSLKKWSPAAP